MSTLEHPPQTCLKSSLGLVHVHLKNSLGKMRSTAGPAEDVQLFIEQLDKENIFARALDTKGVPYHSAALDPLLEELGECELLLHA